MGRISRLYPCNRPLGHGHVPPGQSPVKPRDAATLIVWRKRGRHIETLMGRRARRSSFVPDFFVFPGGRLDPSDFKVRAATALDPAMVGKMGVRGNAKMAQALAIAAIRETFEETGLLLAEPGDTGGAHPEWAQWKARQLAPGLHHLGYFGRAITSTISPIRFNARFFIAHADTLQGQLGDSDELSELDFYAVDDVLRDMPIIDVTEFMLKNLLDFAQNPAGTDPGAPVFCYRGKIPLVRYPNSGAVSVRRT